MTIKVRPLTLEEHMRAAALLTQAQKNLGQVSRIVSRAPFTDLVMSIQYIVQERLIDALRESWETDPKMPHNPNAEPYDSIGYGPVNRVRLLNKRGEIISPRS